MLEWSKKQRSKEAQAKCRSSKLVMTYCWTYASEFQLLFRSPLSPYRSASFPTSMASNVIPAAWNLEDVNAFTIACVSKKAAVIFACPKLTPQMTEEPINQGVSSFRQLLRFERVLRTYLKEGEKPAGSIHFRRLYC